MSQIYKSSSGGGGGGVQSLIGDTGTAISGNDLITALDGGNSSTSTVSGGTTLEVNFTDNIANTIIGKSGTVPRTITTASNNVGLGDCFNALISGGDNVGAGSGTFSQLTSGNSNSGFGPSNFVQLKTGSFNTGVGDDAGANYSTSESHNVLIRSEGVVGDNHVIRIGEQGSGNGQQNTAFMAGIVGNTVSNAQPVMLNPSTGQLGAMVPVSFSAYLSANITNATGDGTVVNPIPFDSTLFNVGGSFNTGTGVFTALSTGNYQFCTNVALFNITAGHTLAVTQLITTGGTYLMQTCNPFVLNFGTQVYLPCSLLIPMTAGDTAQILVNVAGSTKTVGLIGAVGQCVFMGFKVS